MDLNSTDKATRKAAVDRLGGRGGNVVAELIDSIDDGHSPLVRAGLVQAIHKAGGPSSSDASALKRLLASNDTGARYAAVIASQMNPGIVKQELSTTLADANEDQLVRRAAAAALGAAGPQVRSILRKWASDADIPTGVRKSAIRALAACGPRGATDVEMIAADATRDTADRKVSIRALSEASGPGHAALVRLSANASAFVREHAVAGIGRSGSTGDAAVLVLLSGDAVAEVRLEALRAMVALGLDGVNSATVVGLLGDADVRVQCEACDSVGRTKVALSAAITAPLRGLLASGTFLVRYRAALALHAYGDKYGAAQMKIDQTAGSISQRKMASQAYALLTKGS